MAIEAPSALRSAAASAHAAEPPHVRVGPVRVFDGALTDAVDFCLSAIESGRGARVATANTDFIALARRDPHLRDDLERSSLVVADGAPVAWLARIAGARRVRRVAGVDLAMELCRTGARRGGLRLALYGSTADVVERASGRIETEFPGVTIVLRLSPPFRELSDEERQRERAQFAAAAPDLVLVALGCPKQERLIATYFDATPRAVWLGVGGTLDFFAGKRWRAPRWSGRVGLEWVVRMAQEPRRLWRRYLLRDIPTVVAVAPGCVWSRLRRGAASAH